MGKKKAIKKLAMPTGKYFLVKGYIPTLTGRLLNPGDSFTENELTPERLKELREKGLIRGTLTTEEKGTITK